MKTGILFAGQGSQYPGMGKQLYDAFPAARAVFDQAGSEIKRWCFEGTKEALRQTHITQPSVYTVTVAAWAAFQEAAGADPKVAETMEITGMAGFSMGEYAALTAAECLDFDTALALIRRRGEFMTAAGKNDDGSPRGGMAAVMGDRAAILACIEEVRGDDILEGVNFNSPVQTAVAGDAEAIARLRKAAKEKGGLKVVPLSVSTAFHSSMMRPASEKLAGELTGLTFTAPVVPVYSNVTGKSLMDGRPEGTSESDWIKSRLALQVMRPVYWQETVENMAAAGMKLLIEMGPGQTLSGLVRKTCPDVRTLHVEDAESLEAAIREIGEETEC